MKRVSILLLLFAGCGSAVTDPPSTGPDASVESQEGGRDAPSYARVCRSAGFPDDVWTGLRSSILGLQLDGFSLREANNATFNNCLLSNMEIESACNSLARRDCEFITANAFSDCTNCWAGIVAEVYDE